MQLPIQCPLPHLTLALPASLWVRGPAVWTRAPPTSRRCHHTSVSGWRAQRYMSWLQREGATWWLKEGNTNRWSWGWQPSFGNRDVWGWCHFLWIIPFIWLCTFKSCLVWSNPSQFTGYACVLVAHRAKKLNCKMFQILAAEKHAQFVIVQSCHVAKGHTHFDSSC